MTHTTDPTAADRAALRDRIAEELAARFSPGGSVTRGMRVIDPDDEDDPDPARRVLPIEAADAVMPVLPETADRTAVLLWAADRLERNNPDRSADFSEGVDWALDELRRMAAEEQPTQTQATPCSQLNPCEDGELCGTHEVEQAHAEGEHAFCGPTCEAEFPTELLRNTILCRSVPGSGRMLDELLRRAAVGVLPVGGSSDELTAEHHVVDGTKYLCHAGDHYCPPAARPAVGEQPDTQTREAVTVHAVPLPGSNGISSCCGRPPCEFVGERLTRDLAEVTCPGPPAP